MRLMSVTLEVSRLSGWLKAEANCQVEREDTKRARRSGSEEVVRRQGGASYVQGRRTQLQMEGRACAKAHIKHGAHVRDAGGVETQRLVENRRALSSGKERTERARRRGSGEVVRRQGGASYVQGRTQLQMGGRALAERRTRNM